MDKFFFLNLERVNKARFLSILKDELNVKFNNNIDDNYSDTNPWSLINLIKDDKIDCYQLIYVNNIFWSGSGGIVRIIDDKKIYQAGFRAFSNATGAGLGIKSYSHEYNTKYQIERAKKAQCHEVTLSFNLNNEKLFRITRDYHLPKIFGKNAWQASNEPIIFNGVEQWLLTMSLE